MFVAQWDGRCRACGDEFWAGDQVGYIDGEDGVHCDGCCEAAYDAYESGLLDSEYAFEDDDEVYPRD